MTIAVQNAEIQDKGSRHDPAVTYDDDLATVAEIAAFLQVPVSWVYERARRRGLERIPHFKLGKYLRFSRREVVEWVQRHRGIPLASR
jgi:excisionase family DNA binding protein